MFNISGPLYDITSLCIDYAVESCKNSVILLAPCCQIYRVTDETLIVETAVWPIPFLINVPTPLKGSQL